MTSIESKRMYVAAMYNGPNWQSRVKRMSDDTIIAIYMKEQQKKSIPKQPKEQ